MTQGQAWEPFLRALQVLLFRRFDDRNFLKDDLIQRFQAELGQETDQQLGQLYHRLGEDDVCV